MNSTFLFLSTLLLLLLSFLAYQPPLTGSYYRLDNGRLVPSWDESIPGASRMYDIDGDGNVAGSDYLALQRALEGWTNRRGNTDIDGDGATTAEDLKLLAEYLQNKQAHSASSVIQHVCQVGEIRCAPSQPSRRTAHSIYEQQSIAYITCEYNPVLGKNDWGTTLRQCKTGSVCETTIHREDVPGTVITTSLHSCVPISSFPETRQTSSG